jgi:DsbC/DsbD-like thiol-disulfide interchange protein
MADDKRRGIESERRWFLFHHGSNTVANIMLQLGGAGTAVAAMQVSTEQLDLKTYPSDAKVSPGTRFSLVLDITPKRGIHVYAPGATGYRVVTLTIVPQAHVRPMPLHYPPSEIYHFAPLNERVPVYQKPFTLAVEMVADATPEARKVFTGKNELMIAGTLDYQACDDKICYNPVSLPLSWTIALVPNVPGAPQAQPAR